MKKFDLEDRMVAYAACIIKTTDMLPGTFAASHLGRQLIRSGTSVALNYGEAQAAESQICLRILATQDYVPDQS